jgi:hypothetical protein
MRPWLFGTALVALTGCSMRATSGHELTALDDGASAEDDEGAGADLPPAEITALGNEARWRVRLASPHGEARATIDCPFWWGCDVLASFEAVAIAGDEPLEVELELRGGEQDTTSVEGALSREGVTHVRAWGHAQPTFEPSGYDVVLRLSARTATALERAGVREVELDAVVAWQSLGAWGISDTCRTCDAGSACGAGSSCLARGVCFDGGARAPANDDCVPAHADPAIACGECEPLAGEWTDPSVAVRGEIDERGTRCWLLTASDDLALADEQMSIELRVADDVAHADDVYELRLYRDVAACEAQRPLAVAFAHGDAHELRWLETAAPDDGTFVVEVRKRSGPTCGGAFSLSASGLH